MTIRPAVPSDAARIADIFNQAIADRVATLETELRSADERRGWLAARDPRHPVFVAELDGTVAGWCSLNVFNPRRVYDHVVDFSVYVDRRLRGRGLGRALLDHLIDAARTLEYHKIVLAAFPSNAAGMALYRRAGFSTVGIYREQGCLDGRWVDVIIMEKLL